MASSEVAQLIEQLNNKASAKRRSAAKKLRKLKAKEAGPALLDALKRELKDKRTWETQYQMIMALGESGHTDSLDFLLQLAEQDFEATMVYVAIGDAITRLSHIKNTDFSNAIKFLERKGTEPMLIDGLVRAIAMQKLVPSETEIEKIITYGAGKSATDNNRAWIASAAAGWDGEHVTDFLNTAAGSNSEQIKRAAEAALNKKYLKWSVL